MGKVRKNVAAILQNYIIITAQTFTHKVSFTVRQISEKQFPTSHFSRWFVNNRNWHLSSTRVAANYFYLSLYISDSSMTGSNVVFPLASFLWPALPLLSTLMEVFYDLGRWDMALPVQAHQSYFICSKVLLISAANSTS